MTKTNTRLLIAGLLAALAGCAGSPPGDDDSGLPDDNGDVGSSDSDTSGGEDNTFDHPGAVDIWDLLDRLAEEGPPRYASRVHSCPKMRYQTIGRLLASRGVNVGSNTDLSAGKLWRDGDQSLGAGNYASRQRENLELTTASAARLFDIFVQAAPEIIANAPTSAACGVAIFNDDDSCNPDGVTCLLGLPATAAHVSLCGEMVARASTPEKGRVLAVAALAAAGHTCE